MYGDGNLLAVDIITYNRQHLFLEYDFASPRSEINVVKKEMKKEEMEGHLADFFYKSYTTINDKSKMTRINFKIVTQILEKGIFPLIY